MFSGLAESRSVLENGSSDMKLQRSVLVNLQINIANNWGQQLRAPFSGHFYIIDSVHDIGHGMMYLSTRD